MHSKNKILVWFSNIVTGRKKLCLQNSHGDFVFVITGFMPPTDGTAIVNGYDITEDISSVRASLGLCPQHDILFDELTVEEHLFFFAKVKRYNILPTEGKKIHK